MLKCLAIEHVSVEHLLSYMKEHCRPKLASERDVQMKFSELIERAFVALAKSY